MERNNVPSNNTRPSGQSTRSLPQIDHSIATDLDALVNMAGRLQQSLTQGYRWLAQEDLKIVGSYPIDAGGFADVWVGEMGDRKVAVKSYRCYASADYMPTYNVSHPNCYAPRAHRQPNGRGFVMKH